MKTCLTRDAIFERPTSDETLSAQCAHRVAAHPQLEEIFEKLDTAELYGELLRAEHAGEITEFQALSLNAIISMIEGAVFVNDYLEMAEAVADSQYARMLIAEFKAAYLLLHGDPLAAARQCLMALKQGLCNQLHCALCVRATSSRQVVPVCRSEMSSSLDEFYATN